MISIQQSEAPSPEGVREKVLKINAQYDLTWPTLVDEGLPELFGLLGGEHPILLGPDGRMIAMTDALHSKELDTVIGKLLQSKPAIP